MSTATTNYTLSLHDIDDETLTEIAKECGIAVSEIEDVYQCLPQQLSQINEARSEQFQIVISFGPETDIDGWCEALTKVVADNPSLRTRIVKSRLGTVQVVTKEKHVSEKVSGDLEEYLKDGALNRRLGINDLLFYSVIINRTFVGIIHHAVMDHSSISALLKQDMVKVFLGQQPSSRPPYKDFVSYYRSIGESESRAFWASRFKGSPAIFPQVKSSHSPYPYGLVTKSMPLKLPPGVSSAHVPIYIEAAWAFTSAIYMNSENVAYGLVLSGRSASLKGLEHVLGQTVVEIPVQVQLQRNMTIEQLTKDRATSLRKVQAQPYLQYGLENIAASSEAARAASAFQTQLNIIPVSTMITATEGNKLNIRLDRVVWMARGAFTLMLPCYVKEHEIEVPAKFDPVTLPEPQVWRVLNQFNHIFQQIISSPMTTKMSQLSILSAEDKQELFEWNKKPPPRTETPLDELFWASAKAHSTTLAVEASDGCVTYSELAQMVANFSNELQKRGLSPGDCVGVILNKSLLAIVVLLSILNIGGVCVPLDKSSTFTRIRSEMSQMNIKLAVTSYSKDISDALLGSETFVVSMAFISELSNVNRPLDQSSNSANDTAYLIPSAGEREVGKSVRINHGSLSTALATLNARLDWEEGSRVLQYAPLASSSSIYEIYGTLLFGGSLCIPPEQGAGKLDLSGFIDYSDIDHAILTPSTFRKMSPRDVPGLKSLISFGEMMDKEATREWSKSVRLYNGWGASGASMLSTIASVPPGSHQVDYIGRPVGCNVWIVNSQNADELIPIGSVGELLIESSSFSEQHHASEPKIVHSHIRAPVWASSLGRTLGTFHHTGDLGKWNPDGSLCLIGKKGNKVKVGTQPLQLEHLESVLHSCSLIRDVITTVKIFAGRTKLVAVLSLIDPQIPDDTALQQLFDDNYSKLINNKIDAIRAFSVGKIPNGKIPDVWLPVERLPRTTSGRLDRAAIQSWLKTIHRVP